MLQRARAVAFIAAEGEGACVGIACAGLGRWDWLLRLQPGLGQAPAQRRGLLRSAGRQRGLRRPCCKPRRNSANTRGETFRPGSANSAKSRLSWPCSTTKRGRPATDRCERSAVVALRELEQGMATAARLAAVRPWLSLQRVGGTPQPLALAPADQHDFRRSHAGAARAAAREGGWSSRRSCPLRATAMVVSLFTGGYQGFGPR